MIIAAQRAISGSASPFRRLAACTPVTEVVARLRRGRMVINAMVATHDIVTPSYFGVYPHGSIVKDLWAGGMSLLFATPSRIVVA
jgi:hypothetical protein